MRTLCLRSIFAIAFTATGCERRSNSPVSANRLKAVSRDFPEDRVPNSSESRLADSIKQTSDMPTVVSPSADASQQGSSKSLDVKSSLLEPSRPIQDPLDNGKGDETSSVAGTTEGTSSISSNPKVKNDGQMITSSSKSSEQDIIAEPCLGDISLGLVNLNPLKTSDVDLDRIDSAGVEFRGELKAEGSENLPMTPFHQSPNDIRESEGDSSKRFSKSGVDNKSLEDSDRRENEALDLTLEHQAKAEGFERDDLLEGKLLLSEFVGEKTENSVESKEQQEEESFQEFIESEDLEAVDESPLSSLRQWLFSMALDTEPADFHMCDGLKPLGADLPPRVSPPDWPKTQKRFLWIINLWLTGDAQLIDYSKLDDPEFLDDDRNSQILDQVSKNYLFKFLKKVDEFDNLIVTDDLVGKDLFELEWIQVKRGRHGNNVENGLPLQILQLNENSFVVLPKENILSLIQKVAWCSKKNMLEAKFADEKNLEFVDFDTPEDILIMESQGLANPVPETKRLVLRFYRWIVNYIEELLLRVDALDADVLSLSMDKLLEVITGRDSNASFIINNAYYKSKLYSRMLWIGMSNRDGEMAMSSPNKILTNAVRYEENGHYDMDYRDAIGRAFYLYVVEMLGGDAAAIKPSEVPRDYFGDNLTTDQFVGIMSKFKQIVLETAFRMNTEIGKHQNLQPLGLFKPGSYGMDNVATRIATFLTSRAEDEI